MMIKKYLAAAVIGSIFLSGCTYDLEEAENIYTAQALVHAEDGVCEHYFQYSYTVYYADAKIYPSSNYHYVSCAKYGIDPLCDFYPRCEAHQCIDDASAFRSSIIAYNGHRYQRIPQKCEICGQSAGFHYLLDEGS